MRRRQEITAYKTVYSVNGELDKYVNDEIMNGWQPFGSPHYDQIGGTQIMVRYKKEAEK